MDIQNLKKKWANIVSELTIYQKFMYFRFQNHNIFTYSKINTVAEGR